MGVLRSTQGACSECTHAEGTSSGGRLPQIFTSFFPHSGLCSRLYGSLGSALLGATAYCFFVIAALSMTKSIATHRSLWTSALIGFYAAKLMRRLNTQGQAMLTSKKMKKFETVPAKIFHAHKG